MRKKENIKINEVALYNALNDVMWVLLAFTWFYLLWDFYNMFNQSPVFIALAVYTIVGIITRVLFNLSNKQE